jgi:hypothetical protein
MQSFTFMPEPDFRPGYFTLGGSLNALPLPGLAERVATSGAFPGAFPPRAVELDIVAGGRRSHLRLLLADGGIRDNLGVDALLLIDRLSRQQQRQDWSPNTLWTYDHVDPMWRLDLVIASDGGQALGVLEHLGGLSSVIRAVELNGMATGAMRPLPSGTDPSVVLLSENRIRAFVPDDVLVGSAPGRAKYSPEQIIQSELGDDDFLIALSRMHPDRERMAALAARVAAAPESDTSVYCRDEDSTPRGCARQAFAREMGADIWHTFEVFSDIETLRDAFHIDEVESLVRFGRYLVRLNEGRIRDEINSALARSNVDQTRAKESLKCD